MPKRIHLVRFSSVEPRTWELINLCKREPRVAFQLAQKFWYFYLKRFFPDAMANGHSEYVRFITVGRPRTGSNFLRGSLMSHSQIVLFGDIFRSHRAIQWGIPFYPQSRSTLSLFQSDPIRFLETEVFGKFPTWISAVGFKTLYPHTRNKNWEPVRTYLGNQRALKVIHIKRKNILKTRLSLERALRRRGGWSDISGAGEDNVPISLDYEDCLKAFMDTREWEREYDALFEDHDKIDVWYENLSGNYADEMERIQEFLGVEYEVVKPLTHRQSRQPLSEAISNYLELKERFKGTSWEEFFED